MFIRIFFYLAFANSDRTTQPAQFHCFSMKTSLVNDRLSTEVIEASDFINFDTNLEPFKDGVDQFIERVLSPGPGYPQLLSLLETDEYTLKRMVLNILIRRINCGCFQSLLKFSAYIGSKSNNIAVYDPQIRQNLSHLMWHEKENQLTKESKPLISTSDDVIGIPINLEFSKLGKAYLRALCIWETDHLDKRMLTAYAMLPRPLQIVIVSGRSAFDTYFISNRMPSLKHMEEKSTLQRQDMTIFELRDSEVDEVLLQTKADTKKSKLRFRSDSSNK